MRPSIKTKLIVGVSALAFSFGSTPAVPQSILTRAQVVGGDNACPAIFVSFASPLAFSASSLVDGGRGLRIRLNRGAVATTAVGTDLIETYPNLNLPNLGQVGITLDSGSTEPVLVMRFDQAIMAGVEVVQAGDSSIVITGISARGGVGCATQASAQDPLTPEIVDATVEPSVVDLSDPAQAQIEDIYTEARAAITAEDYRRAAQLLTKLTLIPMHARSADAQELLGVVRERNGQLAHAQAEYEIYLETYPDSDGASRVRQRLAALLTAISAPPELRSAGPGFTGPTDEPIRVAGIRRTPPSGGNMSFEEEEEKTFFATLSAYYYLNQGSTVLTEFDTDTTTSDSDVYNNSLAISLEMSDTITTEGFTLDWRLSGEYELDVEDTGNSRLRFSQAYGEFDFTNNELLLRLGRQTRYDGGIFGRFDGALLTYPVGENLTAKFTAGLPVDSSADGLFASKKTIFGASVEYEDIRPGLDVSAYFVHQNSGSYTDRQAIGFEAQFQNETTSAFALVDYDLYFGQLNLAKISGTKVFANRSSLTLSFDTSRSPLLFLTNALQGQTETTLAGLSGFYTLDEMKQLALDRAATTRSASVAYSAPLSEIWMASINASAFQTSGTPASGGVAAVPSTGVEYYLSAQLVGNSVFSERDVVSISARYSDTASSTLVLLDGYRRFQVSENVRLKTQLKVGHRSIVSSDGSEWFAIPSVNMTYVRSDTLDFEVELGGRIGTLTTPITTENSSEIFMFAGLTKRF